MRKFTLRNVGKVESTNSYAKKHYANERVYYSTEQTNGRGRMGRKWVDGKGNLAITFCLNNIDIKDIGMVPQLLALSLCEIVPDAKIKWPNDVMVNEKKVAGILAEAFENKVIVGIGINVNNDGFDKSISHKASSLALSLKKEFDFEDLTYKLMNNFSKNLSEWSIEKVTMFQLLLNKKISINESDFTFVGVATNGMAILKDSLGNESMYSGSEISLESIYKTN